MHGAYNVKLSTVFVQAEISDFRRDVRIL
jgi:hypothetical protein